MNARLMKYAVLAGLLAAFPAGTAAGTAESNALADHALRTLSGRPATLSSYRGEVVVVNFWATWCRPCHKELDTMNEWNTAWSGRGARVVAISIDSDARKAERFAKRAGLDLTVLHDGPEGLARTLDLSAVPSTFLLDRDGRVVRVVHGSSPDDLEILRRDVESMLAGGPLSRGGAR